MTIKGSKARETLPPCGNNVMPMLEKMISNTAVKAIIMLISVKSFVLMFFPPNKKARKRAQVRKFLRWHYPDQVLESIT
jgi:hypothetical protein